MGAATCDLCKRTISSGPIACSQCAVDNARAYADATMDMRLREMNDHRNRWRMRAYVIADAVREGRIEDAIATVAEWDAEAKACEVTPRRRRKAALRSGEEP